MVKKLSRRSVRDWSTLEEEGGGGGVRELVDLPPWGKSSLRWLIVVPSSESRLRRGAADGRISNPGEAAEMPIENPRGR